MEQGWSVTVWVSGSRALRLGGLRALVTHLFVVAAKGVGPMLRASLAAQKTALSPKVGQWSPRLGSGAQSWAVEPVASGGSSEMPAASPGPQVKDAAQKAKSTLLLLLRKLIPMWHYIVSSKISNS